MPLRNEILKGKPLRRLERGVASAPPSAPPTTYRSSTRPASTRWVSSISSGTHTTPTPCPKAGWAKRAISAWPSSPTSIRRCRCLVCRRATGSARGSEITLHTWAVWRRRSGFVRGQEPRDVAPGKAMPAIKRAPCCMPSPTVRSSPYESGTEHPLQSGTILRMPSIGRCVT